VLPGELSGTYRFFATFESHYCPPSFTFGYGAPVSRRAYHFHGSVVRQGNATCEPSGSITAVTTILGQSESYMEGLGLLRGIRLLRTSHQRAVAWASSAGFIRGAWACDGSPAWPEDTFVLWGDEAISWGALDIDLHQGLRHMIVLAPGQLMCAYTMQTLAVATPAPNGTTGGGGEKPPRADLTASPTPAPTDRPGTAEGATARGTASPSGGGGSLSTAAIAAIAVGGVAAVVASGLVAFWAGHRFRAGADAGADTGADAGVDVEVVGGGGAPPEGHPPPPWFTPALAPPPGGDGGGHERRSVDLPAAPGGGGVGGAIMSGGGGGGGLDGGWRNRGGGVHEAAVHWGPPVPSPPVVPTGRAAASSVPATTPSSTDDSNSGGGPWRRPTHAGAVPPPVPTLLRDMFPSWDST